MVSGRQRRDAIRCRRRERAAAMAEREAQRRAAERAQTLADHRAAGTAVDSERLAPYNSYGEPEFVRRGWYEDQPFVCVDCGRRDVWTATQQKWWYEVAKGYVYALAVRCRACRVARRERRDAGR